MSSKIAPRRRRDLTAGARYSGNVAHAPLADLLVLEIVAASHILADLTLAPATVVHDDLQQPQ
jgi:acetoacetate decarboxylase